MAPSLFSSKSNLNKPGPVHKLFTRDLHNFRFHRVPNITVTAPECGPSGEIGNLNGIAAAEASAPPFPTLTWQFDYVEDDDDEVIVQRPGEIKEYLLIIEDLDAPSFGSHLRTLGIYFVIPPHKTTIYREDIVKDKVGRFERVRAVERGLVGGFKYGDLDGKVWRTPKSMHRIHFQVIALSRTVDTGALSEFPTIRSFTGASEGAVLGWGEWVGIYDE